MCIYYVCMYIYIYICIYTYNYTYNYTYSSERRPIYPSFAAQLRVGPSVVSLQWLCSSLVMT